MWRYFDESGVERFGEFYDYNTLEDAQRAEDFHAGFAFLCTFQWNSSRTRGRFSRAPSQ